ncbi:MAG: bifunctional hydroxymethylpyrimidine kinase/phosphomethylpyrimidine kinase [Rikenellaceae bacterium]
MTQEYKIVLTIAGSDCSGGAGIQADLKAISACGCYGSSVITALTAQNTLGVDDVMIVEDAFVTRQICSVATDLKVDALKLGMLPTKECVEQVARAIKEFSFKNIVLDPVMISTSGHKLISDQAIEAIKELLFPLADIITPNIPELEFITGLKIDSEDDFIEAAQKVFELGAKAVLIKAGHMSGHELNDYLFEAGGKLSKYCYTKIDTKNTHGTGCTLSSATASFLAHGFESATAVEKAEEYIHEAISAGATYKIGHGFGPVHHFYKFWK